MNNHYIIIGFGSHAHLLIEILIKTDKTIIGATDIDPNLKELIKNSVKVIGEDQIIFNYDKKEVHLVNGIGDLPEKNNRRNIFDYAKKISS